MGKFNLSDAAKSILLGEGAKENFDANRASKQHAGGMGGKAPHGEVGKDKLGTNIVPGTQEAGDIGTKVTKTTDGSPMPTKGVGKSTPPGATPPVGSEPMKKIGQNASGVQSPQETMGRKDLVATTEGEDEESHEGIVNRKASKLAPQMMKANPGATFQSYAEETEEDGEMVNEAEKEEGHEDEAQDKKLIKAMMKKEKMKEKMKEDIDALLSGESLSEEFTQKATTIFEAAVVARAEEIIAEAEEQIQEQFQLAVEEVKNELAAKLDDYINYMAEEWFKENQLAVESGLRSEITEDFIRGMKSLFEEHYIDIPEEKVNVVEELTGRVEELEEELNEQIQAAVQLKKELNESKKIEAIHTACEGLTQTQVEKMKSLAESIEFTTEEEFADKLETLKESYFKTPVKSADSSALNEEIVVEDAKKEQTPSEDPSINFYAQTISKTLVK